MTNICRYTDIFSQNLDPNKKYAFVLTMFMGDDYFPGLICCAALLKKQIIEEKYTNIDIVAQLTVDSYKDVKEIIGYFVDVIKIVPYINGTRVISEKKLKQKPAYGYVFTKLWGLTYIEYDKIILIDIDFLPLKNFCNLFKLNTPSGALETPTKYDPNNAKGIWDEIYCTCCNYNKEIPPFLLLYFLFYKDDSSIFYSNGFEFGGLNASLFVLKPDRSEFYSIMNEIKSYHSQIKWTLPEQQYLTLRWSFGKLNPENNKNKIDDEIDKAYKILTTEKIHKHITEILDLNEQKFKNKLEKIYQYILNEKIYLSTKIGPWHGIHPTFYSSTYDKIDDPNGIGFFSNKKPWQFNDDNIISYLKQNKGYGLKEWYSYFYKILIVLLPKINHIKNKNLLDRLQKYYQFCTKNSDLFYEYKNFSIKLNDKRLTIDTTIILNMPSYNKIISDENINLIKTNDQYMKTLIEDFDLSNLFLIEKLDNNNNNNNNNYQKYKKYKKKYINLKNKIEK